MAIKRSKTPQTGAKAKATNSKPKFTDKAQSERFIETARKLGIEEVGEAFEDALKTVAKYRPPSE